MTRTDAAVDGENRRTIATRQLVQGILRRTEDFGVTGKDRAVVALANRILQSSIGSNLPTTSSFRRQRQQGDDDDDDDDSIISHEEIMAWRRIENRLSQHHHQQQQQHQQQHRSTKSNVSTAATTEEQLRRCKSLYHEFQETVKSNRHNQPGASSLPHQMLEILSHLTHHGKSSNSNSSSGSGSSSTTSINQNSHRRFSQQQQQQQQPVRDGPQPTTTTLRNPPFTMPQLPPTSTVPRPIYENSNPELVVLQECFYCLQGISGDLLFFDSATGILHLNRDRAPAHIQCWLDATNNPITTTTVANNSSNSSGAMDALRICGESGFLCQRIQFFIDVSVSSSSPPTHQQQQQQQISHNTFHKHPTAVAGAVAKALAVALQEKLQDYHSFLATLETTMLRAVVDHKSSATPTSSSLSNQTTRSFIPTLRWLYAALQEPTRRLYTMAMITDGLSPEGCTPLPAVYVLSSLYRHSRHGDTRHATLAQSLLAAAAQPWWNMLYAWTTLGLLDNDPYHEFFITSTPVRQRQQQQTEQQQQQQQQQPFTTTTIGFNPLQPLLGNVENSDDNDRLLWHFGYRLDESKLPEGMLDGPVLTLALNVGKGINFIRKCLGDTEWTLQWDAIAIHHHLHHHLHDHSETSHGNPTTTTTTTADNASTLDLPQQLGFYHNPQRSSSGSLNVPVLHQALRSASEQVHSHILHVLIEDHHLFHHLWALKQFMLLGQGDFISSLMEVLQQAESEQRMLMPSAAAKDVGGGNSQWSHVFQKQTLVAVVDGALKNSNAKDLPPYVLERLQVHVIDAQFSTLSSSPPSSPPQPTLSDDDEDEEKDSDTDDWNKDKPAPSSEPIMTNNGNGMWERFLLEYVVPDQLLPIVHPQSMVHYRLVFQFLFALKAVEFRLDGTWRQSAAIQHALQIYCQNNGIRLANNAGYSQATILLRHISITRQAMIHLVRNLKSYVMLDVLEGGWKNLVHRIEAATTLDHVIEAHDIYLQGIVRKCWLLQTNIRSSCCCSSSPHRSPKHHAASTTKSTSDDIDWTAKQQWKKLISLINDFCAFQEDIFTESLQAAEQASEKRREADKRKDGQWVFQQEATEEESFFFLADNTKLLSVIRKSDAFHKGVIKLLASLHEKINSPGGHYAEEEYEGDFGSCDDIFDGQTDLDSLRFLTFQLDCNNYYGSIKSP